MRRRIPAIIGLALSLTIALAVLPPVWGKGKGKNNGPAASSNNSKGKVKISAEFPDFPLPYAATLVPRSKQKAFRGWTEYRVFGFSLDSLTVFYRSNMPGHGWKLGHYKGNSWTWRRGRRTIVVVYVRIASFLCLIQVREEHGG